MIEPGSSVLDLGCGVGTNGVLAADRAGSGAEITFVDSNVRAAALAEANAAANGLTAARIVATADYDGLAAGTFDVVLANPPYYANSWIAKAFVERSKAMLKPGGRLYLVTKQVNHVAPTVMDAFGEAEVFDRRGYAVIEAQAGENA